MSARIQFTDIVTRVLPDIRWHRGSPCRFVALISREAADDLGLKPGVLAVAVIKTTEVIVESSGSSP